MPTFVAKGLAIPTKQERAEMMAGTRVRTSHRDYGMEWYSGSGGRVLVIRGGFEYGWAKNHREAVAAIDEMADVNIAGSPLSL